MPTHHQLFTRLTHKYADGWDHLDEWSDSIGTAKLLGTARLIEVNDYGDPTFGRWVQMPKGMTKRETDRAVYQLMHDLFGGRCTHEWDCCGCPVLGVGRTRIKGRMVYVQTTHSRNY